MKTTPVSKCLDKKLLIAGFEIFDIIAILLTLSLLNLFFGQSGNKLLLVWLPTLLTALTLRYGKKGKPDKYLQHLLRYYVKPGTYSAFQRPTNDEPPPRLKEHT